MQKKPSEINNFLNAYNSKFSSLLFYGPNHGLVSGRAANYARLASNAFNIALTDILSTIILHADELESNPQRLLDEIQTLSFFNHKKIIWLKHLNTQPNLTKLLSNLVTSELVDSLLLIEAGDLKKTNGLRIKTESSAYSMAIPCFNDDANSLNGLINEILQKYRLQIDASTQQILLQQLGSDYLLSKSEIEKLCLYCAHKGQITTEDVIAVISNVSAFNLTEIIDYMLLGNLAQFNNNFEKYIASGESAIGILNSAIRQLSQLQALRYELDNGQNANQLIEKIRPPVFFKRKKTLETALQLWPLSAINRALALLQEANLQCRLNNKSEIIITQTLCLKLARAIASKSRA
ncbi:DNA polymerase III subunit delta [Bartonella sp. TP]|uniref:DNA polymerase III subunit delta n=1 Tax=Bartonella sp. TP TaxID=3057550 RepID=UPI0025AF9ED7|nr:DNA polymerase III subunit delta [Bartonella sp. TP]WJW79548.1 DNA polymerase III subunit delta [Bartonella sp. TP]